MQRGSLTSVNLREQEEFATCVSKLGFDTVTTLVVQMEVTH